jgi:hypothetical protein
VGRTRSAQVNSRLPYVAQIFVIYTEWRFFTVKYNNMSTQNYSNHTHFVPMFHFVGSSLLLLALLASIVNLFYVDVEKIWSALALVFLTLGLFIVSWYARIFALKAQDRAIRAEENFRHYLLTGKPLDPKLRVGQIVALRFASDEEFPVLAQRAVAEQLDGKAIKQAITNWKGDYYRV